MRHAEPSGFGASGHIVTAGAESKAAAVSFEAQSGDARDGFRGTCGAAVPCRHRDRSMSGERTTTIPRSSASFANFDKHGLMRLKKFTRHAQADELFHSEAVTRKLTHAHRRKHGASCSDSLLTEPEEQPFSLQGKTSSPMVQERSEVPQKRILSKAFKGKRAKELPVMSSSNSCVLSSSSMYTLEGRRSFSRCVCNGCSESSEWIVADVSASTRTGAAEKLVSEANLRSLRLMIDLGLCVPATLPPDVDSVSSVVCSRAVFGVDAAAIMSPCGGVCGIDIWSGAVSESAYSSPSIAIVLPGRCDLSGNSRI
uniref:Uncharacterized protein n=1 Tax=Steinernema glaseri TaxID=37863 RepID=A0A1I8AV38_9BILA